MTEPTQPEPAQPGDHYFITPTGDLRTRTVTARIWDRDYEFTTANGVFSGDGLDLGTAVLLRELDPPTGALRILDLGCGWGPISIALARENARAEIDAVDTNERALALCARNAAAYGLGDRVHPLIPEAVAEDRRYDQIWSNPPIRIGKPALHAMLLHWLARLTPQGVAYLVVGKNLGADSLQRWLVEQGYACARVASAKGFRVLAVHPSR
ncbi:class I SAM-dependent methyltransferase [Granulicoccus phenolivorans]|uniref:class I SAM-dependent methyltransferase n=1 Tax=Granulicoccus phenolivorans TaxID=266854 RepID=UPI00040505FC|nr:methyltransferase [Granulicoccus phenolivorans]